MIKSDFSKAQVGDKVWSMLHGWGIVDEVNKGSSTLVVVFSDKLEGYFNTDGTEDTQHKNAVLFWDEITFTVPPPPKRKVKKTFWQNVYKTEGKYLASSWYSSKEQALESKNPYGGYIDTVPTEFEVEE